MSIYLIEGYDMDSWYSSFIERDNNKRVICIDTRESCLSKFVPEIIKDFILKPLLNGKKVMIFTNDFSYNSLDKISKDTSRTIEKKLINENLFIKHYNSDDFQIKFEEFLEIIKMPSLTKDLLWIIWDFKGVVKDFYELDILKKCINEIFSCSNESIYNLIYTNNFCYSFEETRSFLAKFNALVIKDKYLEMGFKCDDLIENAIWGLQSDAMLKLETKKIKDIEEMAAGIAHDLNNMLTPIVGSVQLLKGGNIDKIMLRHLKLIEICAYDCINIINKVKKATKINNSVNELEVFYIDEILVDSVELTKSKCLAESKLNEIKIDINTSLASKAKVKGNATELREVFVNIVRNAIDAIPNGGLIEIVSETVNNMVSIEIRDNGIGMNEEIIKKVFQPFFTTKGKNGLGLGLSLSYKIIQSHGGCITIDSNENKGTCFKIELPSCIEKCNNKNRNSDKDIDFNGSILIIDDQRKIRNIVSEMMKSLTDCKIKTCGCEDVMEELNRRRYDIVISDYSMPKLCGIEVARILKNLHRDSYFCLMTGWGGNFNEEEAENVDFILNKPINMENIKELFINYKNKRP
jgi:signal transduction histidine kinase/CheY-like chemotaxis protein